MKRILTFAFLFLLSYVPSHAQTDCEFEGLITVDAGIWGSEISWTISNESNEVILEGGNYAMYQSDTLTYCFNPGCYTLRLFDSFGDGWNGGSISVNFPDSGLMLGEFTLENGDFGVFGLSVWAECEAVNEEDEVFGCTNPEADNYNPSATVDDGTCNNECNDADAYSLLYLCTFNDGQNVALEITDSSGEVLYAGENYDDYDIIYLDLCFASGCFTATLTNTAGDGGWYGGYFYINSNGAQIVYATLPDDSTEWSFDFSLDGSCGDVFGCTDPVAPNYNPEATVDDGTCLPSCECDDEPIEPVCGMNWFTGELITFNNLCELECAGAYFYWEGDCADQPIYGCMDEDALNYDPSATADSGGCLYPIDCASSTSISITSEIAWNDSTYDWGGFPLYSWYISNATSAWYNYVTYATEEGVMVTEGCIEDGCYNFTVYNNGFAELEGSIQVILGEDTLNYEVSNDQFQSTFGLGVNVDDCEPFVPGCTDEDAINYNPDATEDNGSCIYPLNCDEGEIPGQLYVCTFSQGYAVGLTIEDEEGNILFDQQGFDDVAIIYLDICVDATACYTATMTNLIGDESWYGGYFYLNAGNVQLVYESLDGNLSTEVVQFSLDGNCGDVLGCTDPLAANFNPDATIDNGSCIYPVDCEGLITVSGALTPSTWPEEIVWALIDAEGIIWWEGFGLDAASFEFCVPPGCYILQMVDLFGDGWDESILTLYFEGEGMDFTLSNGSFLETNIGIGASCDDEPDPIVGCTDAGAINYDPAATEDDGSCEFSACPTNEVTFVTVTLEDGMSLGWSLGGGSLDATSNIGGGLYANNSSHSYTACLANDCYEMTMWDMNADGWNGGWIEVWMNDELITSETLEEGFMSSMSLGINEECDEIDTGGSPFSFPDPIGFAPYPNPTEGETNLNGSGWDQHLPIDLEMRDVTGRVVMKRTITIGGDLSQWIIQTEEFQAGLYLITGNQAGRTASTELIVR